LLRGEEIIGKLELPDPEQCRSYGSALRAYGRPWRLPGLAPILAGAAGLVADGWEV